MKYLVDGFDPSLKTGYVRLECFSDMRTPIIHKSACFSVSARDRKKMDKAEVEHLLASVIYDWLSNNSTGKPDFMAIEVPPDNAMTRYTRSDGTTGTRVFTQDQQSRIIGHIEGLYITCGVKIVRVTPENAKSAVGITKKQLSGLTEAQQKQLMIDRIETITGHKLTEETKFARSAVADAAAVGIGGHHRYHLHTKGTSA